MGEVGGGTDSKRSPFDMPDLPHPDDLQSDIAVLGAGLAILIAGLYGRTDAGSGEDWCNGTMTRIAAELTGQVENPRFDGAFEKLQAVLSFRFGRRVGANATDVFTAAVGITGTGVRQIIAGSTPQAFCRERI
jgi:hypothetical protein